MIFFARSFYRYILTLYVLFFTKKPLNRDMKFSMANKIIKEVIKTMGFTKKMSIEVRS